MKFIATGDWHCTDKTPESRIDNYPAELLKKINRICYESMGCLSILQPGDLTDSPFLSYFYFRGLVEFLKPYMIYTIYGQHDLKYRNKGNTPLDALETALDNFHIVEKPICLNRTHDPDVHLYAASFEEDIPKITTKGFNILLIHRMIVGSYEQQWEEDKGYDLASQFLQKHKFDLIISGDNHKSFIGTKDDRTIINCGSLMRSKIDQIEHEPFYCIFDTDTRTYEKHFIPIRSWEEVFDIEKKLKTEKRNEKLEAFVEGLSLHKEMGLNFADNLINYEKANNIPLELVKIRRSCMT